MPWLSLPRLLIGRSFPLPPARKERLNESLSAGERPICFRSERPVLPRLGPGLRTVPGIQVGCGRLIGPEPSPRSRHLFDLTSVYHNRGARSEEHTSELQSRGHLVCRLLLEK